MNYRWGCGHELGSEAGFVDVLDPRLRLHGSSIFLFAAISASPLLFLLFLLPPSSGAGGAAESWQAGERLDVYQRNIDREESAI